MNFVNLDACARRLRFPAALEAKFQEFYYFNSVLMSRIAIATTLLLWMSFGILDYFVLPVSHHEVWFLRFIIISPILLSIFVFSFTPSYRRFMQPAMIVLVLAGGFGLVGITAYAQQSEPGYTFYYAGLILVPLISYSFARMRFWAATAANWIVVTVYVAAAVFSQGILQVPGGHATFINSVFFILAANFAGMGACYSLEVSARRTFVATHLLELERDDAQRKRRETEAMLHVLSGAIGVIVHDLGNPLTSVEMGAETLDLYLEKGENDKETFHRITGFIKSGSQMLNFLRLSLIEQLRVLEGQAVPVELKATSLRRIINAGIRYQKPRFSSGRTVSTAEGDIELALDEMKMITVFMNLIGNALKYSDGEVSIYWRRAEHKLIVAVADRGHHRTGITQAQAEQLFMAFGRLEAHREVEGTGFGLLSAQKIVEAHGGELWIEGHCDGTPDSPLFSSSKNQRPTMLNLPFATAFVMALPLFADN